MELKNLKNYQETLILYQKLTDQLHDPEVIKDLDKYTEINSKIKKISSIAKKFIQYQDLINNLKEFKILLKNEPNLTTEIALELKTTTDQINQVINDLTKLSEKKEPHQIYNFTIMEIRGAAGGREANLFVNDLCNMYFNFFKQKKWKYEIWEANPTEGGGYSLLICLIRNKQSYRWLQYEAGVHRVQRIPKTESNGRVHTSTATVAVLEEKNMDDLPLNQKDLRIDTFRSSGAGGQHVNTTDSAVRITHIPTGLIVSCQDGRSQHDNKDKALRVLRARLFDLQTKAFQSSNIKLRHLQIGEGERSEKIRTYNFPQNRITDHRIGLTINNIAQIFSGKLDVLLTPLENFFKNEK